MKKILFLSLLTIVLPFSIVGADPKEGDKIVQSVSENAFKCIEFSLRLQNGKKDPLSFNMNGIAGPGDLNWAATANEFGVSIFDIAGRDMNMANWEANVTAFIKRLRTENNIDSIRCGNRILNLETGVVTTVDNNQEAGVPAHGSVDSADQDDGQQKRATQSDNAQSKGILSTICSHKTPKVLLAAAATGLATYYAIGFYNKNKTNERQFSQIKWALGAAAIVGAGTYWWLR